MSDQGGVKNQHFTTRRGFVAAAGFGMVGVYFLWAGYGAAPLGLGGGHGAPEAGGHGAAPEPDAAGHGGHGAAPTGPSSGEFKKLTEAFIEHYKLADGSVKPAAESAVPHDPVEVYLMAFQWGYAPSVLRLETDVPYRFRMMAVDVAHGASIQFGRGARIVRLRPGALVEQELTFSRPGEYLLYCTAYCGLAHDRMQGRVIVSRRQT